MNAFIAAVIEKKTILTANDGRLLKKSFLGFLILMTAFQTNALGEVVRQVLIDAYLQVSVFVGFTLFVFIGLDALTKFNIAYILEKTKKIHVVMASLLGAIPGCGGAIVVVTQYIQGRISFGSFVAVLTATMGDAAFLLLAAEPKTGLFIFSLAVLIGILTGYVVDFFHGQSYLQGDSKIKVEFQKLKKTFVSRFNVFWSLIFFPGFLIGLLVASQVDVDKFFNIPQDYSLVSFLGLSGAILSIFMWSLNPLSDFQCSTDRTRNLLPRVIDTTNFVTTWVICGFLVFELFMYFTSFDLKIFFDIWLPLVPLIAIFFGFLPGCGPQIIVTTFYLNGYIPLSAEIGNAISNDGDALFPAIALAPKAAIVATLYSAIPAIITAYSFMFFFE